jgi:hypothetical protein
MTAKKAAPKTQTIYVGWDRDYNIWGVFNSKAEVRDNDCDLYFSVKVPKLSATRREPAYIGEFEVELVEEEAA